MMETNNADAIKEWHDSEYKRKLAIVMDNLSKCTCPNEAWNPEDPRKAPTINPDCPVHKDEEIIILYPPSPSSQQ